jgi:divalent metal cation (Fe/Co/Zn/Cd) transporter
MNSESRDYLLGHGKALSVISLALLLIVMTMSIVSWSLTY